MIKLDQYIKNIYENVDKSELTDLYIVEGIYINNKKHTVSLNDENNNGVDFSLINNPVYYNVDGIDVISIFKRNKLTEEKSIPIRRLDANPFIYEEKKKNGWTFDITNEEITKYIKRFLEVCNKINNQYDTIIMVPSKAELNSRFMKAVAKFVKAKTTVEKYFVKMSVEDIYNKKCIDYDSIEKDFPQNYQEIEDDIHAKLNDMESEYFEAKLMPKKYLKYIRYITNNGDDLSEQINDKHILILDDIMSSGSTVSQCVKNINETFNPKSITVITLLSKLED